MDDDDLRTQLQAVAADSPDRQAVTAAMRRRQATTVRRRGYLAVAAAGGAVAIIAGGVGLFTPGSGTAPDLQRPASTGSQEPPASADPCASTTVTQILTSPVPTPYNPAANSAHAPTPSCATSADATTLTASPGDPSISSTTVSAGGNHQPAAGAENTSMATTSPSESAADDPAAATTPAAPPTTTR